MCGFLYSLGNLGHKEKREAHATSFIGNSPLKNMRKVITLDDDQEELVNRVMKSLSQKSYSQTLWFLALFYEQNQKRGPGRPRKERDEDEGDPQDDLPMYLAPDSKHNKTAYSYNDLISYYEYDPRRGPVPPRSQLKLHPDWEKSH